MLDQLCNNYRDETKNKKRSNWFSVGFEVLRTSNAKLGPVGTSVKNPSRYLFYEMQISTILRQKIKKSVEQVLVLQNVSVPDFKSDKTW